MNGAGAGKRMPRVPGRALACLLLAACQGAALGQTPASAGSAAPPSCVDVSINQQAVLAFDCLSRQLAAGVVPAAPAPALDAVAKAPSNQQVGQYNFSALSHRMGSNLGKSVWPQRPPPVFAPTPAQTLSPGH